ncbi:NADH:flavin oxidoreductase/NADH oxidase [Shouchella sp. 1P09AA]|uniref:NADH:flavin oxidoreductase/NADH oxidase n=1 Tax=unclassified Shouchella TaxID=2893065 RepID=UPI0039A3B369
MSVIQTPYSVKNLHVKNRIVMPPMCQYSVDEENGIPNSWHFVHYVSRAVGGAGLIIMEMTGVEPDGRITNQDLGLWADEQIPAYKEIIKEVHKYGTKIGIQIAHAGRKAEDAMQPVGASNIPTDVIPEETKSGELTNPRALETGEVERIVNSFKDAAKRAVKAGFDTIELHGAHGYLLHQFMSPSINNRTDIYGDLAKFGVDVIRAVKSVMPEDMPLIMRLSAVEYIDGGYDSQHSLKMAEQFKEAGVDIFHVSTGGEGVPGKKKPLNTPAYQVPFARQFKERLNMPIIAVGRLENSYVAESVLSNNDADLIGVARGMLNDPYWAMHAIKEIHKVVSPPKQYGRAIR